MESIVQRRSVKRKREDDDEGLPLEKECKEQDRRAKRMKEDNRESSMGIPQLVTTWQPVNDAEKRLNPTLIEKMNTRYIQEDKSKKAIKRKREDEDDTPEDNTSKRRRMDNGAEFPSLVKRENRSIVTIRFPGLAIPMKNKWYRPPFLEPLELEAINDRLVGVCHVSFNNRLVSPLNFAGALSS